MAAYFRSLSTRANLVRRQCHPSFSFILHDDDRKGSSSIDETPSPLSSSLLQQRGFASGFINNSSKFGGFFQQGRKSYDSPLSPSIMSPFSRYMSTSESDNIGLMSNVADVITDTTVQAVSNPAMNEVAVAAADSFFPIALLQHVIDNIHCFTGLNWWASIVVTTLLIRTVTIPIVINQLKATSKLTLMRPRLEEIKEEINKSLDPEAMAEGQARMKMLFKEYGVTPFTPLKGLMIQGPVFICFFLAILNMVEKVPSFKNGGAFWFVDLTAPDALYIFPVLTALSFWITVECNMQEGLEGNPIEGTMKNISRIFAAVTIPLTAGFANAIFCYWITSNLFSLIYGLVLKFPGVKKALGVPEIPVPPPGTTATSQSSFSLSALLKQAQAIAAKQHAAASSPVEPSSSKISDQRISSSSVISQRLKSLEKQVKGRKKNKKR